MTSSSDFVNWMVYLNEEPNKFHALHFYLAQIAAEVRRSLVKDPNKIKTKDFIIEFVDKEEKEKLDTEQKTEQSKSSWLQWIGINRNKTNG